MERLLSHPVDVVMGAYPRRDGSGKFNMKPLPGPMIQVNPLTGEPDENGLIEVAGAPVGFARISRRCIERMVEAYPDRWYHAPAVSTGKAWSFFEFTVDANRERLAEEYHFCDLWRAIGGKVWLDPTLRLSHIGRRAHVGRLIDHLNREKATPTGIPKEFVTSLGKELPTA